MSKKYYSVEMILSYIVEVDEELLKIKDEFEECMWKLDSVDPLASLAAHIAWNRGYRKFTHVEGLAEEDHALFKIVTDEEEMDEWEEIDASAVEDVYFPSTWYKGRMLN